MTDIYVYVLKDHVFPITAIFPLLLKGGGRVLKETASIK
jgi:hypothetical protein